SVPAPENTKRFGIPNSCNECHKDKNADWAEARLADWFPQGRRKTTVDDAIAFSLGAAREPAGIERLVRIAGDASRPALFRANALGHLRNFAKPAAINALLSATGDGHPAIRLVALLSLTDGARDPAVRGAMETALTDPRRTVRMASALGLLNAGLTAPPSGTFSQALTAAMNDYASRAELLSDDPATQLDLGKMFFLAGRWKSAESSLRDAMKLNPRIGGGTYFLGLATLGQGRIAEGAALLRSVDRKDPHRKDAESVLARLSIP
ncbi:MAG: hypothetical protein JJE39_00565, partial [Vicinamibacteria bacterium]|nr:hypothetical protein [Vicinamibacteria bacterium]